MWLTPIATTTESWQALLSPTTNVRWLPSIPSPLQPYFHSRIEMKGNTDYLGYQPADPFFNWLSAYAIENKNDSPLFSISWLTMYKKNTIAIDLSSSKHIQNCCCNTCSFTSAWRRKRITICPELFLHTYKERDLSCKRLQLAVNSEKNLFNVL